MAVRRKGSKKMPEEKRIAEEESDSDFSDSEPESESEPDQDEAIKLSPPSKTAVYNSEGLMDKLADIKWPENAEWIHKLTIEVDQGEEKIDVEDDLARELSFYNQALEGTKRAFEKLQSMNIPFLRPPDYYAEMVKTDIHMEKVKGRLLSEKQRMEEAEERRKARDSKKLSKEIQSTKQKERAKQKKDEIESVKKWRKLRQQSGFSKDDKDGEFEIGFEDGKPFERSGGKKRPGVAPWDRSGGNRKRGGSSSGGGGRGGGRQGRRDRKDSKFGFGGRKGLNKQNTGESTGDFGGAGFQRNGKNGNKKRKV